MEFKVPEKLNSYVPDVYQKNVNKIDYWILARQGIRLLSFDFDGTLAQKTFQSRQKDLLSCLKY